MVFREISSIKCVPCDSLWLLCIKATRCCKSRDHIQYDNLVIKGTLEGKHAGERQRLKFIDSLNWRTGNIFGSYNTLLKVSLDRGRWIE